MNFTRFILLSFLTFSFNQTSANAENMKEEKKNNNAEIKQIIEDFRISIIEKDKEKFVALFQDKTIPWLGVLSDESMANISKSANKTTKKVDQKKPSKVKPGNYLEFIDWIVSDSEKTEEKFWDVKILSDDEIASVHFKYSFHRGDNKTNWGDEAWHLVKTVNGWKINSVIYSVTLNSKS